MKFLLTFLISSLGHIIMADDKPVLQGLSKADPHKLVFVYYGDTPHILVIAQPELISEIRTPVKPHYTRLTDGTYSVTLPVMPTPTPNPKPTPKTN